ncbi:hypothetical protein CHS0354_033260 [Potamilus streckersoni]|uniref:Caspase-3 n=1 Tax=Potamilus streckersoni TaxID=2493646 RepID=A0AAE0S6D6_9BIVA|nr:hypothetical protein CHS0354_033260 [Potamilus streckersoni]
MSRKSKKNAHDTVDASGDLGGQGYSSSTGNAEDSSRGSVPVVTLEELESDKYNMNHPYRGIAIIINNQYFDEHLKLSNRSGTEVDGLALYAVFQEMGFSVAVHENQTVTEMVEILQNASKEDEYHSHSDCFMCAILSHGKEGTVYGTDGAVELENLLKYFKGNACPGLVGKPKIFFIQACQGDNFDKGVSMNVVDAKGFMPNENITKIPTQADVLIAYSSVPGYYCWRNSRNGSWFIQALTEVLQKSWKKCDLLTILTRVNRKVAFDFKSETSNPSINDMKQIPMFTSMLTKQVCFTPKE